MKNIYIFTFAITIWISSTLNAAELNLSSNLRESKTFLHLTTSDTNKVSGIIVGKFGRIHLKGKVVGPATFGSDGSCSFSLKLIAVGQKGFLHGHFNRSVTRFYPIPNSPTAYGSNITDVFAGTRSKSNFLNLKRHFHFFALSVIYPELY
jgi:hypothetical protein